MTIEEFIEARLAEDEAWAKGVSTPVDSRWHYAEEVIGHGWVENDTGVVLTGDGGSGFGSVSRPVGEYIALHDPARVLRQCAAIREAMSFGASLVSASQQIEFEGYVLPPLAAIWSDHPDYDPEWSPPA